MKPRPELKPGDYVRFRSWDSMAREFGTQPLWTAVTILVPFGFNSEMEDLCGGVGKILLIESGSIVLTQTYMKKPMRWRDQNWHFSAGMFDRISKAQYQKIRAQLKSKRST